MLYSSVSIAAKISCNLTKDKDHATHKCWSSPYINYINKANGKLLVLQESILRNVIACLFVFFRISQVGNLDLSRAVY